MLFILTPDSWLLTPESWFGPCNLTPGTWNVLLFPES